MTRVLTQSADLQKGQKREVGKEGGGKRKNTKKNYGLQHLAHERGIKHGGGGHGGGGRPTGES